MVEEINLNIMDENIDFIYYNEYLIETNMELYGIELKIYISKKIIKNKKILNKNEIIEHIKILINLLFLTLEYKVLYLIYWTKY